MFQVLYSFWQIWVGPHFGRFFQTHLVTLGSMGFSSIFYRKIGVFLKKNNVMIKCFHNLALFWVKTPFFRQFYRRKYFLKITTSVPACVNPSSPRSRRPTRLTARWSTRPPSAATTAAWAPNRPDRISGSRTFFWRHNSGSGADPTTSEFTTATPAL
jgi:hypothetical protein